MAPNAPPQRVPDRMVVDLEDPETGFNSKLYLTTAEAERLPVGSTIKIVLEIRTEYGTDGSGSVIRDNQ